MRFSACITAALIAAASAPAGAQDLTLGEAQRLAIGNQPALRALENSARAAQHASVSDSAWPDPRIKLGALNFPVPGFPGARDDMTQVGVSWEQGWPGGDKRRLRSERAHAEAGQLFAETHSQMQVIQRDTGLAWADAWAAAGAHRLSGELVQELQNAVELARIPLASGKGTPADVLAARQALSQAVDRRLELQQALARARGALARWVPEAAERSLPPELPAFDPPPALDALRRALGTHPQHEVHGLAQGVADADVALAREATKADRTVEVGYYARSGGRSDMVMFQFAFELPLNSGGKQDRQIESKLRLADRARELRADHLRELAAGLDAAYAEWRLAGERLDNVRGALLPAARERLGIVLAQHGAASASLVAVLEARRSLVEARLQELQLSGAQTRARVALAFYANEGGHR